MLPSAAGDLVEKLGQLTAMRSVTIDVIPESVTQSFPCSGLRQGRNPLE